MPRALYKTARPFSLNELTHPCKALTPRGVGYCHLLAGHSLESPPMYALPLIQSRLRCVLTRDAWYQDCASALAFGEPENPQSLSTMKSHGKYFGSAAILLSHRFCVQKNPNRRRIKSLCGMAILRLEEYPLHPE